MFVLPTFNLPAAISPYSDPPVAAVRVRSLCNVAFGRRVPMLWPVQEGGFVDVTAQLLFPAGTDVRDWYSVGGADIVEVPEGSGRWYEVEIVYDLGGGFANEHRLAVCSKVGLWPAPLPGIWVPEGPPVPAAPERAG